MNLTKTIGMSLIFLFSFTLQAEQKYHKVNAEDLIPEWHCGAEFAGPKKGYCYLSFMDASSGRIVKKIAVKESDIHNNSDKIVEKALRELDNPGTFGEINLSN